MKKLLIALVLVIAIVAISPKFIGSMVVDERQNLISLLNDVDGIDVSSKSYKASWFGANSVLEITFQLPEQGFGDVTVIVDESLSFGPVIFTDNDWYLALGHSEISFRSPDDLIDDEIMTFINEKVHLSATLTFSNNIVSHITTDEVSFEDGDTQFVAQASTGQFSITKQKEFIGAMSWGGLELKSTDGKVVLGRVAMSTHQSLVSGNYLQGTAILSGDAKFLVDSINISDTSGSDIFTLKKLLFTTSVAIEDDLLALRLNYGAEQITSVGKTFKEANLEIVIADIDINVMQELNVLLASLPSDDSGQALSAEITEAIPEFVDKILANDPSLKVTDFSLLSDHGKIASQFNLAVDKTLFDSQNLMSIMSALTADATGKAPANFFTQFGLTPMIDNFVEQGYLIKQDDILSFAAKYSQAQLHINGKAIQY